MYDKYCILTDYYFLSLQDSVIHPEVEFPDIHLSTFVQFEVKSGHTWLYIPEQLLMPEAEYKKQQQRQLGAEQIAKGMKTSVATLDLTVNQKMLDEHPNRLIRNISRQGKKITDVYSSLTTILIQVSLCQLP